MAAPSSGRGRFLARVADSLPGRVLRRFIAISGYDRALALATQAFVALVPMLIIVATATPSRSRDAAKSWLVEQTQLSGEAASAVETMFRRSPDATQPTTVLGVAMLILSVVGFTRSLQRSFRAAWGLPSTGVKEFGYGLLGAAVLVAEVTALVVMAPLQSRLPGAVSLSVVLSACAAALLWWPIEWLLLGGRVNWLGLLPGAALAGIGQAGVMVMSGAYLPAAIANQAERYGLIGVAFVLVTWLIALGLLLVLAAVLSAEVAGDPPQPHPPLHGSTAPVSSVVARGHPRRRSRTAAAVPVRVRVRDNPRMEPSPRPSRLVSFGRATLICVLILAIYYVVPVEPGVAGGQLAFRLATTVVGGVLITWLIARQVRYHLADPEHASSVSLFTALAGGVIFLALADYVTAVSGRGQFVGLETKTDGLYFALATLTTVGYGDVHAVGQAARVVVAVQLVFNVAVIASGASVLARVVGARARDRSTRPPR